MLTFRVFRSEAPAWGFWQPRYHVHLRIDDRVEFHINNPHSEGGLFLRLHTALNAAGEVWQGACETLFGEYDPVNNPVPWSEDSLRPRHEHGVVERVELKVV